MADGRWSNNDWNSWAMVVTTNGVPVLRRELPPPCNRRVLRVEIDAAVVLQHYPVAGSSSSLVYTAAFCSVIEMNGTASTTRRSPCTSVWRIANPPAVMVFPDPVGEAKALQGCLCADAAIHWHPDALIVVKPDASGPAKEGQAYG